MFFTGRVNLIIFVDFLGKPSLYITITFINNLLAQVITIYSETKEFTKKENSKHLPNRKKHQANS